MRKHKQMVPCILPWPKDDVNQSDLIIKGAQSNFFNFFQTFGAHIFLIPNGKFHSWEVLRLEDINEHAWLW